MAKESIFKRLWTTLKRPAPLALGLVLVIGFAAGIAFVGGFFTTLEVTTSEEFCLSCHEMKDNSYEEFKTTVHYSNASGVSATCSDCHVSPHLLPKVVRKVEALKELYGHITGKIDTPEKFNAHRLAMATKVWGEMKANDSETCRSCHQFDRMDYSEQSSIAATAHQRAQKESLTCIDCHKGIAHKLPDMSGVAGWH